MNRFTTAFLRLAAFFQSLRSVVALSFQDLRQCERERYLSRATSVAHLEQLERELDRKSQQPLSFNH